MWPFSNELLEEVESLKQTVQTILTIITTNHRETLKTMTDNQAALDTAIAANTAATANVGTVLTNVAADINTQVAGLVTKIEAALAAAGAPAVDFTPQVTSLSTSTANLSAIGTSLQGLDTSVDSAVSAAEAPPATTAVISEPPATTAPAEPAAEATTEAPSATS